MNQNVYLLEMESLMVSDIFSKIICFPHMQGSEILIFQVFLRSEMGLVFPIHCSSGPHLRYRAGFHHLITSHEV